MNDGIPGKPAARLVELFAFPAVLALAVFGAWQVLRAVLWWRFAPAGVGLPEGIATFGGGLVEDVVYAAGSVAVLIGLSSLLALVVSIPALLLGLARIRVWAVAWRWAFVGFTTLGLMLGVFVLISEWYFFAEFESRFNTVAIDYLIYPHEVFTNLWQSYPIPLIALICAVGGGGLSAWVFRKGARPWREAVPRTRMLVVAAWVLPACALILVLQTRDVPAGGRRVVNELAANGMGSVLRAAWSRNLSYPAFYPVMDRTAAFERVRQLLAGPGVRFSGDGLSGTVAKERGDERGVAGADWLDAAQGSLRRRIDGDATRPKLNVCIVVEESLGSEFWGSLGRDAGVEPGTLTPHMDSVAASEGALFTHMLADGNRTIRGLEAIFSSFPPLPGDSILARDRSENVETLARVLKRDGYESLFLYAGHGRFDFIRSYSRRNGWDRLIEESDFKSPAFRTAWGVSDEDLLRRGVEEMRALHERGRPFLTSFMTVSNHRPYTYPAGRIPQDPNEHRRSNAVLYADWALGDFFARCEKEPFWKDTIFVVVADHGARVYGSQTIPLSSYRVPCVIVAPGVIPPGRRLDVEGSQIDGAPTILGLIGRPYESLFFGQDLTKPGAGARSRCLMHHNRSVAIYHDGRQVVFGLNKSIEYWVGDPFRHAMRRADPGEIDGAFRSLELDGVALFQVADELYMNRRYRLDATLSATGP